MDTNPRPKALRGGEGGVGEANTPYQIAEAISALISAATCNASHTSLGRLAALWATRLTGAQQSAVFLPQAEEGALECAEPVGLGGPLVMDAPLAQGANGSTWQRDSVFRGKMLLGHGLDFAVPIPGPKRTEGILAVGGADPERALLALPILAGALGPLFGMTPSKSPSFLRAFLKAPDPSKALPEFLEGVLSSFGAERGALFVARPEGGLVVPARVGVSREYLDSVLSLYPHGPGGIARETGEAVQIEDTLSDVRAALPLPFLQKEKIRSLLLLPSFWNQHFVGGFALYSSEPRCFPQRELERAAFVAEVLGTVLGGLEASRILEALPTAVVYEGQGGPIPLNRAAKSLVPLLKEEARHFFARARQGGSQEEISLRVQHQETPRILCANGVPYEGGALAVLEDVTAFQAPEQKQRELVYLSSHALRDPLTLFRGHIGLAEERLKRSGHKEAAQQLERLKPPLKRLEGIADDLLDLARLESGEFVLHREEVDLVALLRQLLNESAFSACFTIKPGEALSPVRGDQARLRRVLHHLCAYAARFVNPEEQKIILELKRVGREAEITFHDSVADSDAVLEYQPLGHGLGLGGHLAVRLLRLHGGRLLLLPEAKAFSVILPLCS